VTEISLSQIKMVFCGGRCWRGIQKGPIQILFTGSRTSIDDADASQIRYCFDLGEADTIAQSDRANSNREVSASASIPKKEVGRTFPTESWPPCQAMKIGDLGM
jgi:hypothetical protein